MATVFPYGMGMRSTASFETPHIRPKNYRETILRLWPNGDAPLTAILGYGKSRKTDDPHYYWFEKELPQQQADAEAVDKGGSSYTGGGSKGDSLVFTTSANEAREFRAGHIVEVREKDAYTSALIGRVTVVNPNGDNSTITVTMMEDDPTSSGGDLDFVRVVGNSNPEGGMIPDSVHYNQFRREGLTQIFRTPLDITRTARKTRLRGPEAYPEMVRDALELHSIEMEKGFLYGVMDEWTGVNGQPERTTEGLFASIKNYSGDNGTSTNNQVWDFTDETDTYFVDKSWLDVGKYWLDLQLEKVFRYGRTSKMALCDNSSILAINRLAEIYGEFRLTVGQTKFGMQITEWQTPFGLIYLKSHPLLVHSGLDDGMMCIFEPENIAESYIDQTMKKKDDGEKKAGHTAIDGIKEEFLTETGFEYHQARTGALLYGVGKDHPGA